MLHTYFFNKISETVYVVASQFTIEQILLLDGV